MFVPFLYNVNTVYSRRRIRPLILLEYFFLEITVLMWDWFVARIKSSWIRPDRGITVQSATVCRCKCRVTVQLRVSRSFVSALYWRRCHLTVAYVLVFECLTTKFLLPVLPLSINCTSTHLFFEYLYNIVSGTSVGVISVIFLWWVYGYLDEKMKYPPCLIKCYF